MNRSLIGWIALAVVAVAGSAFAWLWFAGGSGEPSTELTTPTIATTSTVVTTSTSEATSDATVTTFTATTAPSVVGAFVIEPGGLSIASFTIDEEFRGTPQKVVGTTTEVAGQVQVDIDDLSTARFSDIVINARTFRTDSDRRDRAMRGPVILNSASDEFEFITFTVTAIDGLTGSLAVGESVQFNVSGDLTIKGTTAPASFNVQATLDDANTIEGSATAQVLRSDFEIGIPSVPGIANVSDQVTLTLDFVAVSG